MRLTDSERRMMELLIAGKRDREIARAEGAHPHTVCTRLARVFMKLGADTRAQAAAIFVRHYG